jgi:formylglycine-generating enzyme required for sulfatase activity
VVRPARPVTPMIRKAGDVLTLRIRGDIGMKFAWVPPGPFRMGGKYDTEKPGHRVTISLGFYFGVFPVTQAQWQAVMGYNPSRFRGGDRPVEQVSWHDCQEFSNKLALLTGRPIRLPTEAEWEYACRAGTTKDYHSGNNKTALTQVGWFGENSNDQTHPVGKLAGNAWGLFDMHGNVGEWCADGMRTYSAENETDPIEPDHADDRIVRGGAWCQNHHLCRAAWRGWDPTGVRYNITGLRVCFGLD